MIDSTVNLAQQIYEKIRRDIVELRLAPGSFLLEREISERLGVSRTPVREAIKRLTQEGWLVAEERRRAMVKGFSLEEGAAVFQFRDMAESFSLRWVFENGMARAVAGQLDLVLQAMDVVRDDFVDFIRADVQFHSTIVNSVGNEYLSRAWETVGEEIVRVAIYGMDHGRSIDSIMEEHRVLVQSMWEDKMDAAMGLLHHHHDLVFAGLKRQLARSDDTE